MDYRVRIKALIEDTDTIQKALAAAIGLNQSTLSNYVTGRTATTPPDVIAQIAQYFHVTTDYLLGLTDTPEPPFPVSAPERELLTQFRTLTREQKELIAKNVDLMVQQNQRG